VPTSRNVHRQFALGQKRDAFQRFVLHTQERLDDFHAATARLDNRAVFKAPQLLDALLRASLVSG
jgi:hypothetical protein